MAQHALRVLSVLVGAAVIAPAAQAQFMDSGWYFEIGVGKAEFKDADTASGDLVTRDFFDSYELPVQTLASTMHNKDRSYSLISGYRLNPYVSFEAGYFRLGAYQYASTGTVSDAGTILPSSFNYSYRAKGFLVGATGTLPLGEYFDLRARAGVSSTDTRIKYSATVEAGNVADRFSQNSQDFYYGAGVGLQVWSYYRLGLDLMRHASIGRASGTGSTDVDNLLLSFSYVY